MEKRFCKDCIHLASKLEPRFAATHESVPVCRVVGKVQFDPIRGELPEAEDPMVKNANFDCQDWTPKNGTRTARGPDPKKAPGPLPPSAPTHKPLLDLIFDDLFGTIFGKPK